MSYDITVFSSALVLLAGVVVQRRHGIVIETLVNQDYERVLQRSIEALQQLGSESRMASRCCKYLQRLLHNINQLGKLIGCKIWSILVVKTSSYPT